jgi:hypothetical protein
VGRYDQTSQNEREDNGERFKSNKNKIMTYVLKFTKKGQFNINLKVKRSDIPLGEGKKERTRVNLISSMLWLNPR